MTDPTTLDPIDEHGTATAADTVRLERWLPGPAERLWRYLTEPELREMWLAGGPMDLHVGGAVELVFRNNALTTSDDRPPPEFEGVADLHRMHGRVTVCEPPHRLAYTWAEASGVPSEVTFELVPHGSRVLLVLTHTRLSQSELMLNVSAGWHTHLALLRARLAGTAAPAFWRTFTTLRDDYTRRLR